MAKKMLWIQFGLFGLLFFCTPCGAFKGPMKGGCEMEWPCDIDWYCSHAKGQERCQPCSKIAPYFCNDRAYILDNFEECDAFCAVYRLEQKHRDEVDDLNQQLKNKTSEQAMCKQNVDDLNQQLKNKTSEQAMCKQNVDDLNQQLQNKTSEQAMCKQNVDDLNQQLQNKTSEQAMCKQNEAKIPWYFYLVCVAAALSGAVILLAGQKFLSWCGGRSGKQQLNREDTSEMENLMWSNSNNSNAPTTPVPMPTSPACIPQPPCSSNPTSHVHIPTSEDNQEPTIAV